MLAAAQVLRIIPDQAGKGGSKTVLSTFAQNLDIRVAHDFMVFDGRWRTVPQAQDYGLINIGISEQTFSLHNYLSYDTSNAALLGDSVILSHNFGGNANFIYNHNFGFSIRAGSTTPNSYTPAVFLNIKNRCFICWSGDDNFIISDPTVAFDDPSKIYDVGVNPPATPPTYTLDGFLDIGAAGLGVAVTYTSGSNKVNGFSYNIILAPPPVFNSGTKAVSIGGVNYNVQSPGGYIDTFPPIGTLNISGTMGTDQLTVAGFIFPGHGDYFGLQINIGSGTEVVNISSYTTVGSDTVVTTQANLLNNHVNATGVVIGEQFVLTTAYNGPSALMIGVLREFFGNLAWVGGGPQYAYAYYDPISGHVSNASPILQVTEQDQPGVTVVLDDLMPSVVSDQDRFTQIIIFRTLIKSHGAVLFPISVAFAPGDYANVPNAGGPQDYGDGNPDSALLAFGGLQAPIVNNAKPPPFTHWAYWDTRLWGNPVNDPSAVAFSCDLGQCPFGIPEESFPSINILRIPADDGRVTAMRLIGGTLVVATERYSYLVDGSNEQTYRLTRFGSGTYGVGDYQMTELPGDTSETASAVLYLGRDGRVYIMAPQFGNVAISDPIADTIKTALGILTTQYYLAKIHYFTAPNQRLALLSLPPFSIFDQGLTLMYDFDRKIWFNALAYTSGGIVRPEAFATIYGGSRPVDLIFASAGQVFSWMRNEDGLPGALDSFLELPVLDFGQPKYRKQLQFVRAYTNAPSLEVKVWPNESTLSITATAAQEPDPLRSIYQADSFPTDSPTTKELVSFPLSSLTATGFDRMQAYRFRIRLVAPSDGVRYEIYALDVGWATLEDPSQVSI